MSGTTGTATSANPGRVMLECIAGKDEHRRIAVEGSPLRIGHISLQPALAIAELSPDQGYLTVYVANGMLVVNAEACLVPVYVNNGVIQTSYLQQQDVLRIGSSVWRGRYGGDWMNTSVIKEGFSHWIGLESLKDFRLSEIFSEVFKKHTAEEMEEQLITGTSRHTPALADLSVGWAKPWLFARLLAIAVLLTVMLYSGWEMWANIKLIPGLIVMGSFAVPLSALIFFLEMNVPRNVSLFKVLQLLFIGGIASLILTLILADRLDFISFLGASAAGIIEESAKVLIVILFMGRSTRYPWILNGMLFGAAVGTGFAAFESAGYAFKDMLEANSVAAGIDSIVLRGALAPFGHIIWTGNAAAALWIVKGDKPFSWDMVKSPAFLRVFISGVLLHMLWNAPFKIFPLPIVKDLKLVILGVIGWVITLRLVQAGLQQLNKARQTMATAAETVGGTAGGGVAAGTVGGTAAGTIGTAAGA